MALISPQQERQFHEEGYFVTEPMFASATLQEMADEFDRLHNEMVDAAKATGDELSIRIAQNRPFIGQTHTRSEACARFVKAPIYLEACAKFVSPDSDLYYNQAVIKPPGKGMPFAWHQDSGYHLTKPVEYITCWTAISRTFIANGCIWVIPRSHKLGLVEHRYNNDSREHEAQFPAELKPTPVEMQPGQIAIFSSLLLHQSGANTSNEFRRGYVPQYHHADMISARDGKPWGDRVPVLRGGKPV